MADGVPAFDDIPSFDDLPDAAPAQASAQSTGVPRFDDIPSFDDLPDDQSGGRPTAETPLGTGVREALHAVIPTAAGLAGAGAGAALGAPLGPVGAFVGGVGGMVAASMGADKLQHAGLDYAGFNDDEQRQANLEANPKSAFVGGLAPVVATMSPVRGVQALQRATSGGLFGAFEAGQEYMHEGHVDPAKVAIATAAGVAAPAANRVGEALAGAGRRMVPGRPGRTANPEAAPAHADVGDTSVETDAGDSVLAEAAPGQTGDTIGNPQSAPERSAKTYPKNTPLGMPEKNYVPTQGDMDPATSAALDAASPAPAPEAPPAPEATAAPQAPRPAPDPVVEAGFPQPGEPVATGENEATPMPPAMPARAQEAIAKSKEIAQDRARDAAGEDSEKRVRDALGMPKIKPSKEEMPDLVGETPINDSITDAQKAAGNYPKASTPKNDFGKPVRVETHAGDTRRSPADHPTPWEVESPYDYGYFGKTIGPDKDPIDMARPVKGSPEAGDKHFIIDQKDAATGKYDEPKVFTYYKDKDAAIAHYNKGFSDGKGPDRLHDITEVTRPQLVKFLAKHSTKPPTGPYGTPMPKLAKPVAERAVVQDAVAKLRAQGKTDEAEALLAAPPEKLAAAIEGQRTRKYGVGTGNSAGYPVEGLVNSEGKPVTANTKAKAAERSAAHKKMVDWFEESAPPKQLDPDAESNGELLDRIKGHPYPTAKGAWKPTFKTKEWMLAQAAKNALTKPTPGNIKAYRDAERLLRSGDEEAIATYRDGNRIEADIAKGKRSGDDAINKAEAANVDLGRNTEEDKLIEAIDAKKNAKFDVPHEEAEAMVKPTPVKTRADLKELPKKTVDVTESPLAEQPKLSDAAARRKAEAAALAGRQSRAAPTESVSTPEAPKATAAKSKPVDPAEAKRMLDELERATKKHIGMEALPAERRASIEEHARDLTGRFIHDERGSLDIGKLKKDFDRLLRATDFTRLIDRMPKTEAKSYLAAKVEGPRDAYVRSLDERLHRTGKEDVNQLASLLAKAQREWPAELRDNVPLKERIFDARDADSAHLDLPGKQPGKTNFESLPQHMQDLFNKYLAPIHAENDKFVQAIRAIDPERVGPDVEHHQSHIQNGDTSQFNMLKSRDDPMEQGHFNGLSVSANAAKTRKYFVLERAGDGRRTVVEPTDSGYTIWDKGKQVRVKDPAFEFEDGKQFTVTPSKAKGGGPAVNYTMRQATVNEKQANVTIDGKPIKYFKDPGFSAAVANAQLGSMARHLQELHNMEATPEWKDWTTTNDKSPKVQNDGWAQSNMPNFKGTYMHPDLKALFDDFAGNPQNTYQALNAAVTKLIFVSPTAHLFNQGAHYISGRGWDNLSIPKDMKVLADLPWAIKSVLRQDPYQQALNRAGAGTIYGKVITKDMIGQLGKAFKLEVERNPSRWGPIADKFGVPLHDLINSFYRATSKALWAGSDVFTTLRVRELQRKGIPMEQAIIDAERDLPNYRIPTKILGNRFLAQKFFNSAVFSFSRYHFGMINAYANVFKDAFGPKATMGDRVDAAGKLLAIGLMGMVAYPLLDEFAKKVTGNKNAEANRRGPLTVPGHIVGALQGKEDIMAPARAAMTISPLLSTAAETLSNHDFRGKAIVEPGDVKDAAHGHAAGAARAVGSFAEHIGRGLVAPYNMVASTVQKAPPGQRGPVGYLKSAAKTVRDQALDVKDVSPAAAKYNALSTMHNQRDVTQRFKKGGNGPLEGVIDKVFGR